MSKARRAVEKRLERYARVEAIVGTGVICQRCRATLQSFADDCKADLDDACEGFRTVDAAYIQANKELAA